MSSLASCLKRNGVSGAVADALKEAQKETREEGYTADKAAKMAVRDAIDALNQQKKDVLAQVQAETAPKQRFTSEEVKQADADLDAALGDLGELFSKVTDMHAVPVQDQQLVPVLTRIMDAMFRKGFYSFRDNARATLALIREKLGTRVADSITLEHVQGSYIAMSGGYRTKGADTLATVGQVSDISDLLGTPDEAILKVGGQTDVELRDDIQGSDESQRPSRVPETKPERKAGGSSGASGGRSAKSDARSHAGRAGQDPKQRARHGKDTTPDHGEQDREGDRNSTDDGILLEPARNYRITNADKLGDGGAKTKARQNLEAVRIVKTLEAENRQATTEEQAKLVKFVGWGMGEIRNGLFPAKGGPKPGWKAMADELRFLLTDEEYKEAKRSTQYAHYTSEAVVRRIYNAVERMGFQGGAVMEPGMGSGNFVGLMPEQMAGKSNYTGIEYDTITAGVAKALYPESNIKREDFTKSRIPTDFFDLAIGNPPFADVTVLSDPRYRTNKFKLHDYFFAKSIDAVRPGGLLVLISSRYTMDKVDDAARAYMGERADLLGAVRLPQTAFKANAGTEVVTDVIFLQKRAEDAEKTGPGWLDLKEIKTPEGKVNINEYFAEHPEMILGESRLQGTMYGPNEYTVIPGPDDIEQAFARATLHLPSDVYEAGRTAEEMRADMARLDFSPDNDKEGGMYVKAGRLMQTENGVGQPVKQKLRGSMTGISKRDAEVIRGLIPLRIAAKDVLHAQLNDQDSTTAQAELTRLYDAFTRKYGSINDTKITTLVNKKTGKETESRKTKNFPKKFQEDPEAQIVAALEHYNEQTNTASKAAMFTERVISPEVEPKIDNAIDALPVVLNELGTVDMEEIAERASVSEQDAIDQLGDLVYRNPVGEHWQTQDEYLSGRVRLKLREAETAAETDSQYKRNVAALREVQPKDLMPAEITARMGSPWIPPEYIEAFAAEEMGVTAPVRFEPHTFAWFISDDDSTIVDPVQREQYSTKAMNVVTLMEHGLNQKQPKVTVPAYLDTPAHTDTEATEAAQAKLMEIKEKFEAWIWQDGKRADRLVGIYNQRYNDTVPRVYDGAHLTLPGMSKVIDLRPHQKRVVWRIMQNGSTYMAHTVGAGKTMASVAAVMEQKRLGLVKKPLFVVPNHMLQQFSREFLELYPAANILVANEASFHSTRRQRFFAQVSAGNWDGVIVTHSAFSFLKVSEQYGDQIVQEEIDEYREALDAMIEENGDDYQAKRDPSRRQLENKIEKMEQKLSGATGTRRDAGYTFEELGIDQMIVDEAHEFRKLAFPTQQGAVKGIDPSGSQRSFDLYTKARYLRELNPGRGLVLMSGTPVTNTMGEMFNLQRYLAEDVIKDKGIARFDGWSSMFGDTVANLEQTPSGKYKQVTRFAKFVNLPELVKMFRDFADVVSSADLEGYVKRPVVRTGGLQVEAAPRTETLQAYQQTLQHRINAIASRSGPPKKGDDILLSVITDGRMAAIDMRLVDPSAPNDPDSKLNHMVRRAHRVWEDTNGIEYADKDGNVELVKGAAQMIFADVGVNASRGFSAYQWMKSELIRMGVPADQIAFMQDHKKSEDKMRLFNDMNTGRRRILIGSTKSMGTGVNAQQRLIAMHHMDAPWFPADVEQRIGRMVRQGNKNAEVDIFAWVTEGTYDATMWQMNETKQRFIDQALSGDTSIRTMGDVDGQADQFAVAKAIASGDERLLRLAGLQGDVQRLDRLRNAHVDEQYSLRNRIAREENNLVSNARYIKRMQKDIAKRSDTAGDKFKATIGGKEHTDRKKAGAALLALAFRHHYGSAGEASVHKAGILGGFNLTVEISGRKNIQGGKGQKATYGDRHYAPQIESDISSSNSWYVRDSALVEAGGYAEPTTPLGIVAAIESAHRRIEKDIEGREQQTKKSESALLGMRAKQGAKFTKQAELDAKRVEMDALEAEMAADTEEPSVDETQADKAMFSYSSRPSGKDFVRLRNSIDKSEIPILFNPSKTQAKGMLNRTGEDLRLLVHPDTGDIVVWPAGKAIHADMATALKLNWDDLISTDGRHIIKSVTQIDNGLLDTYRSNWSEQKVFAQHRSAQFSMGQGDVTPLPKQRVQAIVDSIISKWDGAGPKVNVAGTFADLPQAVQDQGSPGANGAYYGGEIYLVADKIGTRRDAEIVIAHELSHDAIEDVVADWAATEAQVRAILKGNNRQAVSLAQEAAQRGYEDGSSSYIKEILAIGAERHIKDGPIGRILQKIRAAIRRWLKRHGLQTLFPASEIDLLVVGALRPRQALGSSEQFADQPMFAQQTRKEIGLTGKFNESDYRPEVVGWAKGKWGDGKAPDDSLVWQNFVQWFGDSQVVDENGEPLVVYHGTDETFHVFDKSLRGKNYQDEASRAGFFFHEEKEGALFFGPNAVPVYLRVRNPDVVDNDEQSEYVQEWLRDLEDSDPKEYEFQMSTKAYENTSEVNKGLELAIADKLNGRADGVKVESYDPISDETEVWWVVKDAEQIKATGNAGTFSAQDPNILHSAEPKTFHSAVKKAALGLNLGKGQPGAQVWNTIRKQPGVKADELAFLDLENWLHGQARVTKRALTDYISAHELEVEEADQSTGGWTIKKGEAGYEVYEPDGGLWSVYGSLKEAKATRIKEAKTFGDSEPKFANYQLPGGTDYREVFLTAPDSLGSWKDGHPEYDDVRNPISRIRHNTRTDAEGRKVLFIEEIQKPQPGEAEKMPPFMQEPKFYLGAGFKWALRHAAENGHEVIAWTPGKTQSDRYSLSRQVDSVEIANTRANGYTVIAMKDGDKVIEELAHDLDGVEELVGKDLAEKAKNLKQGDVEEFSGLDLEVGGAGLTDFYDKTMPAVVGKYVKKMGGKVGLTTITKKGDNTLEKTPEEYLADGLITEAEAERLRAGEALTGAIKAHAVAITPKMKAAAEAGQPLFMVSYHGTPNKLEGNKLSTEFMGTGEGAQTYGWGAYVAENQETGRTYQRDLSGSKKIVDGMDYDNTNPEHIAAHYWAMFERRGETPSEIGNIILEDHPNTAGREAADLVHFGGDRVRRTVQRVTAGFVYDIDIPDSVIDQMLDWDKPLSEQAGSVKAALANAQWVPEVPADWTGGEYYERLGSELADAKGIRYAISDDTAYPKAGLARTDKKKATSLALDSAGIPGIKYFDAGSRQAGDGTRNFVLFNPERDSKVIAENDKPLFSKKAKTAVQGEALFSMPDPWVEENRRIRDEHVTVWDNAKRILKRNLAPGGLLPKPVFGAKIDRDAQFNVIEFDAKHLVGKLEAAVKSDYKASWDNLPTATEQLLGKALTGDIDDSIPEATKTAIVAMREHIDSLSSQYADIVYQEAAQFLAENKTEAAAAKVAMLRTVAGNIGTYVNRSYRVFDDENWAKKVPVNVLSEARAYLADRYEEKAQKYDDWASKADQKGETDKAEKHRASATEWREPGRAGKAMERMLKHGTAYDSMMSFIKESKLGAKDLSILIRRKEIAPEIRALLGEYTDPRINYVKSATKTGRLVWNHRFLEKVKEIGMGNFLFAQKDAPLGATAQIAAGGNRALEPLDGLWTFPDVNQGFIDALGKEQMGDLYRTIIQINGLVKYGKTVLSPTTAARNWQSAMFFTLMNGHFDLTHMRKSVAGLREYFTHQGKGEQLAYLRRLQELGVVYDNPYAGEMMRLLNDSKIEDELLGKKGFKGIRGAMQYATKFYQYGDDFWKIIGFENEKNLLMEKAGYSQAEAEKMAAERIRDTYPTYSMVGRAIQSLRRFPLAGTFVSFPAEIIRTTGNIIKYAASDMKDPRLRPLAKRRMLGMAMATGVIYAAQALSKTLLGIDDDEEEAVRMLSAPWNKNSNLMFWGRDEKGALEYIDLSFVDPYNYFKKPLTAIMRNQPWGDSLKDVLRETLSPFLGTDIAAGAIFEVMANKREGTGTPVYREHDNLASQSTDIVNHLRKTLQPGVVSNIERTYKAVTGKVSPSGRKYEIGKEAVSWVGWRATTLDPKVSLYYRSFEFKDKKRDVATGFNRVIRDPNKVSDAKLESRYEDAQDLMGRAYTDMIRIVAAARKGGLTNSQIRVVLKNSGISRRDVSALIRGDILPYMLSKASIRNAAKKARVLFDGKMVAELRRRERVIAGVAAK